MFEPLCHFLMFIPIIAFHGFVKAWVAHQLGDDTAQSEGRLTLNPAEHIDIWGTLLMPAISIFLLQGGGLIGWGKGTPVNSYNLAHPRRDEVAIALAGPVANLILAFLAILIARIAMGVDSSFMTLAMEFATLAIFLALFNLLPYPTLDGWVFIRHFCPPEVELFAQTSIYWYLGLLVILWFTPLVPFMMGLTALIGSLMKAMVGA